MEGGGYDMGSWRFMFMVMLFLVLVGASASSLVTRRNAIGSVHVTLSTDSYAKIRQRKEAAGWRLAAARRAKDRLKKVRNGGNILCYRPPPGTLLTTDCSMTS